MLWIPGPGGRWVFAGSSGARVARTGADVAKYGKLRIWAERGSIHIIDEDNDDEYISMSCDKAMMHVSDLRQMTRKNAELRRASGRCDEFTAKEQLVLRACDHIEWLVKNKARPEDPLNPAVRRDAKNKTVTIHAEGVEIPGLPTADQLMPIGKARETEAAS